MTTQIENMENEISNLIANIQSLKTAFTQVCSHRDAVEAENLGLRLECQGLKAEIAEVKSYWKEAARKNAEMLAREANRLGGGL